MDSQEVDDGDKSVIGYSCHGQGGNQYFLMSKTFEIRREDKCLDYAGGQGQLSQPGKIVSLSCHSMQGNQMWHYEVWNQCSIFDFLSTKFNFLSVIQNEMIRHSSGFCVELSPTIDKDIFMGRCDPSNNYQKWFWKKRIHANTTTT